MSSGARVRANGSSGSPGLSLHVEEDHHHVLHHILRGVGAKRIPLSGNAILHLDSHPDLLLPRSLSPEATADRRSLLSEVSIENWILPMAYMGVVDRVVWVRPPWSSQIREGEHLFQVGVERGSGRVRTTCLEPYFVSEGVSCHRADMEEEGAKDVRLLVVTSDDEDIARKISSFLGTESDSDEGGLILDVDLDYFSTRNPFLGLYPSANLYERLRALYVFHPYPSGAQGDARVRYALESCERRARLLDELEDVFRHLSDEGSLERYSGPGSAHVEAVRDIVDAVEASAEGSEGGVDWMQVHDAGCTCDDTELPHHVSDMEEVQTMCDQMYRLLTTIGDRSPVIITMARSALDEFTPPEQVEQIQEAAIATLKKVYPEVEVHFNYDD